MLRHDALKPELAGELEHRNPDIACHVWVELDAVARLGQQFLKSSLAYFSSKFREGMSFCSTSACSQRQPLFFRDKAGPQRLQETSAKQQRQPLMLLRDRAPKPVRSTPPIEP